MYLKVAPLAPETLQLWVSFRRRHIGMVIRLQILYINHNLNKF